MYRICRLILGGILLLLCGWFSTVPLSAHHLLDDASEGHGVIYGAAQDAMDGVAETAAMVLPPNFINRRVVSGLTLPTDMVILPSGDFLVTEKGLGSSEFSKARVRLVRHGVLRSEPVVTLGVNSESDSGLMGIILDPDFATNSYFYLWYSTGEDALGWDGTSYNRLSRFVFDAARGKADLASETIILDRIPWARIHNGGGLMFDDDGTLFISTGDARSDYGAPATHLSQSLKSLNGKLLRIRPLAEGGYEVPQDNPYVGNNEGILPEIYASGLRNPFRITRRAADQALYFIDVGQSTWEEINRVEAGANYGWPYREGKCKIWEFENCDPTPSEFTDPVVSYLHPIGGGSGATALAFYEGEKWPAQYHERLFIADYNGNWIGTANLEQMDPPVATFATFVDSTVDMEATADGIYLLSIAEGTIRYIYYDVDSNHPPVASLQATPVQGKAPLQVTFTATATDLDDDDLFYLWNFGDGIQITTTQSTVSHPYLLDGDYLATLQVVDEDDGRSEILSQIIQVYSGEQATILPENLTEPGRILYQGGDKIRFHAMRESGEEGLDPDAPYTWAIILHHNEHEHFELAGFAGKEVLLELPVEGHALNAALHYEITLAMRTATGQTVYTRYILRPQVTTIQTLSWPGPATITIDQLAQEPGQIVQVTVGEEHTLEAPERIVHDGKVGVFRSWVVTPSWPQVSGGEANSEIEAVIVTERIYNLVVPVEATTYVAYYEYLGPATYSFLPSVMR